MFGERLAQLRKERNLTQAELAELADIAREQISRYERNKQDPDFSTVVCLAKALEVSVNSLLSGPERNEKVTEEDIRFALSVGDRPITPAQFEEIMEFARYVQERDKKRGE